MKYKKLGKSDLNISILGLGSEAFSQTSERNECFEILNIFHSFGGNFIDTANNYASGESEKIIGDWLKTIPRNEVIIASKVGNDVFDNEKFQGLSEKLIRHHVEQSLNRLSTDYIDLYQAHFDDTQTPLEETLYAFNELKKEGKIRYCGCCNYRKDRIKEAYSISKDKGFESYISAQNAYMLIPNYRKHLEHDVLPATNECDMGVIIFKALAGGFLTGIYRKDKPLPNRRYQEAIKRNCFNDDCFRFLEEIDKIALNYSATTAQTSLAWYLNNRQITSTLVGASKVSQIQELIKATEIKLLPNDYKTIQNFKNPE